MSPLLIAAAVSAVVIAWLAGLFLFLAIFAGAKRRDAAHEQSLRVQRGVRR